MFIAILKKEKQVGWSCPVMGPVALVGGLLALLVGGCAHGSRHGEGVELEGGPIRPAPPLFLTGPAVNLLTNRAAFGAELTMTVPGDVGRGRAVSGRLLQQEGKLFFEPGTEGTSAKRARASRLSYIWDAARHRGYVLSEALQGYAPLAAPAEFNGFTMQPRQGPVATREGHSLARWTATATAAGGRPVGLEFLRANDLGGVTIQIDSPPDAPRFALTLSRVKLEPLPARLFLPPEGFTLYTSPEAMMDELLFRQAGTRRTRPEPPENTGPPTYNRPQRYGE
jgi:hypothetical protein